MAKIFKKLSIGDIVASSGTRVFKKLAVEEQLPIWNGTDLTGTTWVYRRPTSSNEPGGTAEAGYGQFEVDAVYDGDFKKDVAAIYIGYSYPSYASLSKVIEAENTLLFVGTSGRDADVWFYELEYTGFGLDISVTFKGGTDATNPRLIDWLINNADLVSHQPAHKGGLYDADDNLVASWNALVYTYGMYVENGYANANYNTIPSSPYCVLTSNSGLSAGTKLIIPDSVRIIRNGTFIGCDTLTSVIIPNSVISIHDIAFARCANLTSITIPDSVIYIGVDVFAGCNSLIYNKYNGANYLGNEGNPYHAFMTQGNITDCVMHENTKVIVPYACLNCTTLKSIVVNGNVKRIVRNAFSVCQNLASVTLSHGVERIENYAFNKCTSLISVIIPDSITAITDYAFSNCNRLTDVYYCGTEEQWAGIDISIYGNERLTNATIHYNYGVAGLYDAEDNLVASWDTLESDYGVEGLSGLTTAISNNSELATGTKLIIPDSVTSVIYGDLVALTTITDITLGAGVSIADALAFYGCPNLTGIWVVEDNPNYCSENGVLFSKDKTELVRVPQAVKVCTIPDSVTTIGDYSFYCCKALESITIPDSVAIIEHLAFGNCESLASVKIGSGVKIIDDNAFSNTALTSVTIPEGVTELGLYAFDLCKSLTSVVIPVSVTTITGSFNRCPITDVYYRGTKEQWEAIKNISMNPELLNATIHYNYTD